MRKIVDLQTGSVTEDVDAPVVPLSPEEIAQQAAYQAEISDRQATIDDPFVQGLASLTRAQVIAKIDSDFSGFTVAQRQDLKAMALAARFAIRKGI